MYLLEVKGLKKEGQPSIDDVSFTISDKGVYGFLAKTEDGKTLLAQILAGACNIDEGSIFYKERLLYVNEKQTADIKKKIGYISETCLFDKDITVFEILDLIGKAKSVSPDKRFRQIKEATELTGLSLKRDTLIDELLPAEKKRLMIASALLGNPDVIIMDEPFRFLEKKQADEIKKLVAMLGSRKAVLIFSARADDIESTCMNILMLHNGRVIADYNKDELMHMIKENHLGSLADVFDALTENVEQDTGKEEE